MLDQMRSAVLLDVVRDGVITLLIMPSDTGDLVAMSYDDATPWGGALTIEERAAAESRLAHAALLRGDNEARASPQRALVDEVRDARPAVVERPWAGEVAA